MITRITAPIVIIYKSSGFVNRTLGEILGKTSDLVHKMAAVYELFAKNVRIS